MGCVSGSCCLATHGSCFVVVRSNRALWLVARRAHAAEWLERFEQFGRLRQGALGPVIQPAASRHDESEAVHPGETVAAPAQSDGGILGHR